MKKAIFLFAALLISLYNIHAQTVIDIDSNVYHTITIGTQIWMVENLRATRFNDSTEIPLIAENLTWQDTASPGYCWYNNDTLNRNTYGALYNWYAVSTNKLAPKGWRVPTDADWTTLTTFLGGAVVAGGEMKSIGTIDSASGLWYTPNTGASNSSGFTALPGGYRYFNGAFDFLSKNAFFWSCTKGTGSYAYSPILYYNFAKVVRGSSLISYGFSVRCVKGFPVGINNMNDLRQIKIYPNPAKDFLIIDDADGEDMKISIFDIFGKSVKQIEMEGKENQIDISSLSPGIYLIEIVSHGWRERRKFIKE